LKKKKRKKEKIEKEEKGEECLEKQHPMGME
jgi:hypothetical protein